MHHFDHLSDRLPVPETGILHDPVDQDCIIGKMEDTFQRHPGFDRLVQTTGPFVIDICRTYDDRIGVPSDHFPVGKLDRRQIIQCCIDACQYARLTCKIDFLKLTHTAMLECFDERRSDRDEIAPLRKAACRIDNF